jgi:tetratricopeptide (TPR) repeat protein
MNSAPPKPMCFVAMPFGKKPPPGKRKPLIDFDRIYQFIESAVIEEQLECVRADFEAIGGFIHRPMYERLLVAEYVIADLTLANPNVTYEVGVRHGSYAKATVLVCAGDFVNKLPFDLKPLRVLTYSIDKDGTPKDDEGEKFRSSLRKILNQAVRGELPPDNPILQVTASEPSGRVQHEKTDVFLQRMRYASEIGERVYEALNQQSPEEAIRILRSLEKEVLSGPQVVSQLHTALIAIYIGYREKKAYSQMAELYEKLPTELQQTPVAIEQLALALNRLAEQYAAQNDLNKAETFRRRALRYLDEFGKEKWSSETYGIAGRIYKGQAEAERKAGNELAADSALKRAIETYENGFRHDPRDYYPGVNAVTLRLNRGSTEDFEALKILVPAVRFSVDRAPSPEREEERYWQEATKLELACADRDWVKARDIVTDVLAIKVEKWMHETTIDNLNIQKQTFADDATATAALDEIIRALSG